MIDAFQERFSYITEGGWDRQTFLLLALLAIVLAIWLLYRIIRSRPLPRSDVNQESDPGGSHVTKVPLPPLPNVEAILPRIRDDYPEFVAIVEKVLAHISARSLMTNSELRRGFAHLESLVQRAERTPPKGSLGIASEVALSAPETKRDLKATMLTLIRLLDDVEGVREKSGSEIDELVDRILEKV